MLIGGTAAGVGESFKSPFSRLMPGIERHATVIDGILRQDFLKRRAATALLDLAAVVVGGLLIGGLAARRGLLAASLAFALLLATCRRHEPLRLPGARLVAQPVPAARGARR